MSKLNQPKKVISIKAELAYFLRLAAQAPPAPALRSQRAPDNNMPEIILPPAAPRAPAPR